MKSIRRGENKNKENHNRKARYSAILESSENHPPLVAGTPIQSNPIQRVRMVCTNMACMSFVALASLFRIDLYHNQIKCSRDRDRKVMMVESNGQIRPASRTPSRSSVEVHDMLFCKDR